MSPLTAKTQIFLVGLCLLSFAAPQAFADEPVPPCVYPQLQILLPGEVPTPGTANGKSGQPETQVVGVPFQVHIRACDSQWETYAGVNHVMQVFSSDGSAELPLNTPMDNGELITWVTLNAAGDFTFTARDLTDGNHYTSLSATVRSDNPGNQAPHLEISTIERYQAAGTAMIVTISAHRGDGHLDTSISGQVGLDQLTSHGQGVISPETVYMANGQWTGTVTCYLADPPLTSEDTTRLMARMPQAELHGISNYFQVAPGPYSRLLVIAPGQNWTPWILDGMNGSPQKQYSDGPFVVDVYATDQWWNRVDVSDLVKLESGDFEANTPAFGPLVEGHRTFEIAMRTPGSWFLAVGDMDQPEIGGMVSQEVPVWYSHLQVLLPGEESAPGTATGKIGQPLPQTAGLPVTVKIQACNANFEPVPTDRVVARLTTTDHTAELPQPMPMNNGELVTEMTFNSSGTFTVNAEDITGPEYYQTTTPAVSVSGSTGLVADLIMDPVAANQTAGAPTSMTIRAVDDQGDQVHTFNGTVNLEQLTSFSPGSMEPAQISLSGGQWSGPVTFHVADQSAGPDGQGAVQIQASSGDDSALTGLSNYFRVSPGALSQLLVLLPGQYLVPASQGGYLGGPATQATGLPFFVEIYGADQYWNKTSANHTVILESLDSSSSTPVQANLSSGQVSIPVTFGSVGNWTLTARDLTDSSVTEMTTVPVSVLSSSPEFVIDAVESPLTAGEPNVVTIRVLGTDDELLEGYNGHAILTAETGPQTIEPSVIQFSGGTWSGPVTMFGSAQQTTFSCIDYASPPNIGSSAPFQVLPGAFAGLQVLLPGQENDGGRDPGFVGEPDLQEAGQEFNTVIQAVDAWWNVVPDVTADLMFEVTDPFALKPEQTRLTDGQFEMPVTFLRSGRHTLTAHCDSTGIASYTSSEFPVQAGPYARIIALAPGEELMSGSELGKVGLAVDQSISHPFTMRTLATDNWWNPVGSINDLIELICTDTMAQVPPTFSLLSGQAETEIQLATSGYQLMTLNNLSNPDVPPAHTQMRAIESGFHLEAAVHPEVVIAGEPFTLSVQVVNDAGAVMHDVNGFADVEVINSVTGEAGQGELLAASFQFYQGQRSISQTYTVSEPIILIVTSQLGEEPGMTGVLSVVPGEPASLEFHETSAWVAGRQTTNINAKVADQLGNGIPEVPVEFNLTGGLGFLEVLNDITDEQGLARAVFTGASQPGSGFIEVASAGFVNSMEIMTSLMDPGSSGGTISNYPNPFHPGEGSTTITYMLSRDALVTMRLFTLSGTLVFQHAYAAGDPGAVQGINEVDWDGRNGEGQYVASGGYILYVEAESQGETIHQIRRRIAVVR